MAESELLVAMVCGVLLTVVVEVFVVLMWIYSKPPEPVPARGQFSPYVPAQSPPVGVRNHIYDAMFYWLSDSFISNDSFSSVCIKKLQHTTERAT